MSSSGDDNNLWSVGVLHGVCATVCVRRVCRPYVLRLLFLSAFLLFTFAFISDRLSEALLVGTSQGSFRVASLDLLGVVICVKSSMPLIKSVRLAFRIDKVGSVIELREDTLTVLLRSSFRALGKDAEEDMR